MQPIRTKGFIVFGGSLRADCAWLSSTAADCASKRDTQESDQVLHAHRDATWLVPAPAAAALHMHSDPSSKVLRTSFSKINAIALQLGSCTGTLTFV